MNIQKVPRALVSLFDQQMQKLVATELAMEGEIKPFFSHLKHIRRAPKGEGVIPFVIVPQPSGLTLAGRMEQVIFAGRAGESCLALDREVNYDKDIPSGHYLITGLEDGRVCLDKSPINCFWQFQTGKPKRYGCTAAEGISMAMYEPERLEHHFMDLTGSGCSGGFLYIFLDEDYRPTLFVGGPNIHLPNYGSPSCAKRLGLPAVQSAKVYLNSVVSLPQPACLAEA